jgi:hypothetical protein
MDVRFGTPHPVLFMIGNSRKRGKESPWHVAIQDTKHVLAGVLCMQHEGSSPTRCLLCVFRHLIFLVLALLCSVCQLVSVMATGSNLSRLQAQLWCPLHPLLLHLQHRPRHAMAKCTSSRHLLACPQCTRWLFSCTIIAVHASWASDSGFRQMLDRLKEEGRLAHSCDVAKLCEITAAQQRGKQSASASDDAGNVSPRGSPPRTRQRVEQVKSDASV